MEVFPRDVQLGHNSNWEVINSTSNLSGIPNQPDMFEIQLNEINVAIQKFENHNPSFKKLVLHSIKDPIGNFSGKIIGNQELSQ